MSALRAFLGELIDDAGLFPPAALSLDAALAANQRAAASPEYWMLGRFVVPVKQLASLARLLDDSPDPFSCSVVFDASAAPVELAAIARLASARADRLSVEALETPLARAAGGDAAERISRLAAALDAAGWPERPSLFIELATDESIDAAIAALREARDAHRFDICAKLRCGGATPGAVPDPHAVARFIHAAQNAGVPFKATAGLHHPFRHYDPVFGATMHGFINVVGAAVLAAHGADEETLHAIVADEDAAHFRLDEKMFSWRGRGEPADAVGAARTRLIRSFGSCSFSEPVEDLRADGFLARQ